MGFYFTEFIFIFFLIKIYICLQFNYLKIKINTFLGNLKELTKMCVKSVPGFQNSHNRHVNYTSWKVHDEIIQLCADEIYEIIVNKVSYVGYCALMCVEAR